MRSEYATLWGTACWGHSVLDLIAYEPSDVRAICRKCERENGECEAQLEVDDRAPVKLRVHVDE